MTRYSGEYDCEIEADSDRPISVTHKLDILIPPQVTSEPADGNVVVKKGSSVSIKCHASGNPKPHVTWKKVNEDDIVFCCVHPGECYYGYLVKKKE